MSHHIKVVHNKLLGGWFVVRGKHHAPISGRFDSKAAAKAWLRHDRKSTNAVEAIDKYTGDRGVGFTIYNTF